MANWNLPTVNSNYLAFVDEINGRTIDAFTMGATALSPITNMPVYTMRFQRGGHNTFDQWDGATWVTQLLSIDGGGTGSNSAAGARTNLGIGSMGTQNSNAVNITGGSITGVAYSASDITTGIMPLARGGTGNSLAIGSPGFVLLASPGGQVVFSTGVNIDALDASKLTQGTVPSGRLTGVALLAGQQTFTQANRFDSDLSPIGPVLISSNMFPALQLYHNTGANVDLRYIRLVDQDANFYIQRINIAYNTAVTLMTIANTGAVSCIGSGITNLNAANITDGIVNPARLGTGTANSTTFLRGDGTWQVVTTGGGGTVDPIPSGLIALFDTNCPAGWTRVAALDTRFPLGSTQYGVTGGSASHSHNVGLNTSSDGGHTHAYSNSINVSGTTSNSNNNAFPTTIREGSGNVLEHIDTRHTHTFNVNGNFSGNTDGVGNHSHQVSGGTSNETTWLPYLTVIYCRKN